MDSQTAAKAHPQNDWSPSRQTTVNEWHKTFKSFVRLWSPKNYPQPIYCTTFRSKYMQESKAISSPAWTNGCQSFRHTIVSSHPAVISPQLLRHTWVNNNAWTNLITGVLGVPHFIITPQARGKIANHESNCRCCLYVCKTELLMSTLVISIISCTLRKL